MLYRLFMSKKALHYCPTDIFWPLEYPYHLMMLERVKETYCSLQMNQDGKDLVKTVNLWLKEQNNEKIQRPGVGKKQQEST